MSKTNTGWSATLKGMPQIGATATREKTMSRRDIDLFTEISGDRNPLHFDEALARASSFGGLIVQGGVTSGLLNALVAEDPRVRSLSCPSLLGDRAPLFVS